MANYDGSVRIKTEIETKKAQIQLAKVENQMMKTADKAESLRSEMRKLEETKIPTKEYANLQAQLDKAISKYEELNNTVETFRKIGMDSKSTPFRQAQDEAQELYMTIEDIRGAMFEMEESGKAFTLGVDSKKYADYANQLKYAENDLYNLAQQHEVIEAQQVKISSQYRNWGDAVKSSFGKVHSILKKADDRVKSFGVHIKNIVQKHLPSFRKQTEKASGSLSKFGTRLKSLLSGIFIFNVISSGFRKMFSAIKEGYENLYNDNKKFKNSIDSLKASALTLKNAFAAAFAPLVQIAIPYIQKVIEWVTKLADSVGQLIAAITGQKTYLRAVKQTTAAIKEETKANDKQLSSLDKLNNLTSDKNTSGDSGSGGTAFEEVPIDDKWQNIADKINDMLQKAKDVLNQFFNPLKEAWNRVGKKVIDAWKYALDEVWKLIKDIGRDFLTVWNQEATIRMFEDVLRIIQHIGTAIGNLARQFRLAWNENDVGLHILENIRDIIAIIIHNIQVAAAYTALWAGNLDFYPLLDKLNQWLESFKPVLEALTGVLLDFYTKVILPLSKWVLEKGLPDLLQVFIDFNNKVDWESLRANLAEFWNHLEPFSETVGEGLIIFIERVSDALANFLNSQEFKDFLVSVEEWMDRVTPEDVADALENIAKGLIALKLALLGFSAIQSLTGVFTTIKTFLSFFGGGGLISKAIGGLKSIGVAIAGWAPHIAVGAAIAGVLGKIKELMESKFDTSNWQVLDWISNTLETSLNGWKSQFEGFKISLELWWQDTWMSDAIWRFGQWWDEKVAPWFTKEKWTELWDNIKQSASQKWSEIKQTITEKISETKTEISTKLSNIKSNWYSVWTNLKSKVESVTSQIKSTVKSALDWIEQKIDSMKSKFSEFKSNIGGLFSSGSSSKARTYAYSPAVATLSKMSIPGYATGQVIPRTMKQHLAILGDNNRETEIVSPLSTIEQAVENVMGRMNGTNGELTIKVPVEIDGNVLFEIVKKYSNEQFKRTGKPAFS